MKTRPSRPAALLCVLLAFAPLALAQTFDSKFFSDLRWRSIGPFRGGRTRACAGVPGQPNVFYIGVVNGGVWKTTDYGRTWKPIFDDQPTGSIGAIAVAPSDPNIIYVGSGEGLQRPDLSVGDGIYKSTDAGKTWTHLGLRDGQQIPQIVVDPRNPEPAVRRRARPSVRPERGARHLPLDRRRPDVPEGALQGREHRRQRRRDRSRAIPTSSTPRCGRRGRARGRTARGAAPNSGIFKSTDGGTTWRQLTQRPAAPTASCRPSIAIAPSDPQPALRRRSRPRAARRHLSLRRRGRELDARPPTTRALPSASAAATCRCPRSIRRIPTSSIVASVVTWKSTDGGKTWTAFRGAPGGDDYQNIWINPNNPDIILLVERPGRDRHASTAARRWSSWYNQPTAQIYHVDRRQRVPLPGLRRPAGERLGVRREPRQRRRDHVPRLASGRRRGVRLRRARPARSRHRLRRQGDALRPAHRPGAERRARSRVRAGRFPHAAHRSRWSSRPSIRTCCSSPRTRLWKTRDGGSSWQQISPDLTRKTWEVPASVGKYRDAPTRASRRSAA